MLDIIGREQSPGLTAGARLLARAARVLGRDGQSFDGSGFFLGASAEGCKIEDVDGSLYHDLTSAAGSQLLGYAHGGVKDAMRAMFERGLPRAASHALGVEVAWNLQRAFEGPERIVLLDSGEAALALAVDLVRRRSERRVILDTTARMPAQDDVRTIPLCADALRSALREGGVAGVLVEPLAADARSTAALAAVIELAKGSGLAVVMDERMTAFRLAARSMQELLGLRADLTCIGESLAAGLPFGAVLGRADHLDLAPSAGGAASLHGHPIALAAARATLEALRSQPVAARIAELGEHLRAVFQEGCAKERLAGRLSGPPGCMELAFEAQENADGELIRAVFLDELRRQRTIANRVWMPSPAMSEADVQQVALGIRLALRRLRTLLIEHNSYLSGGLPWTFATPRTLTSSLLAERGLAIYRYPARAPVDVAACGDGVGIRFAAGDLGEVTSSGFWVPTRLRGDFAVRIQDRLRRWLPRGSTASLGLFAQDELSFVRYYAQRSSGSAAADSHYLLANLAERLFHSVPVRGEEGELSLVRQGQVVSSWHRSGDEWILLGQHTEVVARDMVIGCKIWSSGACDGLEAELSSLVIENELPADQMPFVPVRPDPRGPQR